MIGTWQTIPHPMVTAVLATQLDFVVLDMEHGSFSLEEIRNCINAKGQNDCAVMVRAPSLDQIMIQRIDELGPDAIMIPGICGENQFISAYLSTDISYKKGVSPYTPLNVYGDFDPTLTNPTPAYPMIEHVDMVGKMKYIVDKIMKTGYTFNLSICYIGAYDLSKSMGITGQIYSSALQSKMEELAKELRNFNIKPGCLVKSVNDIHMYLDIGYEVFAFEADCKVLMDRYEQISEDHEDLLYRSFIDDQHSHS